MGVILRDLRPSWKPILSLTGWMDWRNNPGKNPIEIPPKTTKTLFIKFCPTKLAGKKKKNIRIFNTDVHLPNPTNTLSPPHLKMANLRLLCDFPQLLGQQLIVDILLHAARPARRSEFRTIDVVIIHRRWNQQVDARKVSLASGTRDKVMTPGEHNSRNSYAILLKLVSFLGILILDHYDPYKTGYPLFTGK